MGSFNGVPTPCKVEGATGALKISVEETSFSAPTVNATIAARDNNRVPTSAGTFNGAIRLFKVTSDGNLRMVVG